MKISRTIGTRTHRPQGRLAGPTPEEYEWSRLMARYRTRVPKGVFRYASMEEANADWERWNAELVAEFASQNCHRPRGLPVGSDAVQYARPATWDDVIGVARLLDAHGVRYILVGGYALAAHGYVRMTEDIDIAVAPEPEAVGGVSFFDLERHIAWLDLHGERVPVLDLEGLLKTKQGARPKDQADAQMLQQAIALRKRDEGQDR